MHESSFWFLSFVRFFPRTILKENNVKNYFCDRQIDGHAPTFLKKPAIRQEDDGKRLLFECLIKADPVPTVKWAHNETPVSDNSRHKVNLNSHLSSWTAKTNCSCWIRSCRSIKMARNITPPLKSKMLPSRMPVNTRWRLRTSLAKATPPLHWTLTVSSTWCSKQASLKINKNMMNEKSHTHTRKLFSHLSY